MHALLAFGGPKRSSSLVVHDIFKRGTLTGTNCGTIGGKVSGTVDVDDGGGIVLVAHLTVHTGGACNRDGGPCHMLWCCILAPEHDTITFCPFLGFMTPISGGFCCWCSCNRTFACSSASGWRFTSNCGRIGSGCASLCACGDWDNDDSPVL